MTRIRRMTLVDIQSKLIEAKVVEESERDPNKTEGGWSPTLEGVVEQIEAAGLGDVPRFSVGEPEYLRLKERQSAGKRVKEEAVVVASQAPWGMHAAGNPGRFFWNGETGYSWSRFRPEQNQEETDQ